MSLPQDGVNGNALAEVTTIPTGKKLIFLDPDTSEGGIITLENLTKQILSNLTSQTFNLDQGTKTLPAALNELNSNRSSTPMITYDGTKPLSEFCKGIVKTGNVAIIYVKSSYKTDITGFPLSDGCYVATYKSATPGYAIYYAITNKGARYCCVEDGGNFSKWEAIK